MCHTSQCYTSNVSYLTVLYLKCVIPHSAIPQMCHTSQCYTSNVSYFTVLYLKCVIPHSAIPQMCHTSQCYTSNILFSVLVLPFLVNEIFHEFKKTTKNVLVLLANFWGGLAPHANNLIKHVYAGFFLILRSIMFKQTTFNNFWISCASIYFR